MYVQTNSANGRLARGPRSSLQLWQRSRYSSPAMSPAGLSSLGDDAAILAQVFAGQSGAPAAPLVQQTVQQAMSQGELWTTENCTGIVTPGSQIASAVLTT